MFSQRVHFPFAIVALYFIGYSHVWRSRNAPYTFTGIFIFDLIGKKLSSFQEFRILYMNYCGLADKDILLRNYECLYNTIKPFGNFFQNFTSLISNTFKPKKKALLNWRRDFEIDLDFLNQWKTKTDLKDSIEYFHDLFSKFYNILFVVLSLFGFV